MTCDTNYNYFIRSRRICEEKVQELLIWDCMKHAINTINTMHQFLAGAARMSWCKKNGLHMFAFFAPWQFKNHETSTNILLWAHWCLAPCSQPPIDWPTLHIQHLFWWRLMLLQDPLKLLWAGR